VAIAKHFQIQDEVIVKRLKSLKNLNHRLELKKEGLWNIIDDSYNSNPRGFIEALEVLKTASTKKILITPGLIELNQYNESLNKKIATYIKKSVDLVVLVGKNADSIHQELLFEKMDEKKIKSIKKAMIKEPVSLDTPVAQDLCLEDYIKDDIKKLPDIKTEKEFLNDDIIKKQIIMLRNAKNYNGFSLFRYDSLFNEVNYTKSTANELDNLQQVLKK